MATAMIKRTSSSPDDWDAPPSLIVLVVLGFIWFLVSMIQLLFVLKRLKAIPPMAARGPYIILSVITLSLALSEALSAVLLLAPVSKDVMDGFAQVLWGVDTAFRPAVVLYLVHQRGDVLRAAKGNTTFPLSTQTWKRIMDWILVAIALIMYMGAVGAWAIWDTDYWTAYWTASQDYGQTNNIYGFYLRVEQTSFALLILLCIDVVVSLAFQIIQGRGTPDPILNRLQTTILPLFCAYLVEVGFFDIFPLVSSDYNAGVFAACSIFFDGAVRIAITTVLILTMTLPGVLWTPRQVLAPDSVPGAFKESSISTPINVGYTPQQQPASYWPQPHVLPHEMPLGFSHGGNPYALPAELTATSPATTQDTTYQELATQVHSITPRASTHSISYQPLYPSSMRALPYQSPPPESPRRPNYPSPSPESTPPLPYQIPLPAKAAPKQYQSTPSPAGERFTHAVLPEKKKERQ